MLRSLGVRTSRPQVGGIDPEQRASFISVAFLNHEDAKKLECREIFKSWISRIIIDSTKKSFLRRDPLSYLIFFVFFFSIRVFAIQYDTKTTPSCFSTRVT